MACSCFEEMDAKLAEHNSRMVPVFCFPRDGSPSFSSIGITCEKINTRKRERVSAIATFCPFCGVPYRPPAAEALSPTAAG